MKTYNEKQIHIMQAAVNLFAEQGFTKTSVRQIAEAADVNLAMISYYFGSKQELLEAIFEYNLSQKQLAVDAIMTSITLDLFQKMDGLVDYFIDSVYEKRKFNGIVIRQTAIDVDTNSPIFKKIVESRTVNRKLTESIIKKGQTAGIFRKHIDIVMLSCIIVGAVNHVVANTPYYREVYHIEDGDDKIYKQKVVNKLGKELKTILKTYLRNDKED
ncbi:MAG: TetR family transcriptional regulator [Niabella sp.]